MSRFPKNLIGAIVLIVAVVSCSAFIEVSESEQAAKTGSQQ